MLKGQIGNSWIIGRYKHFGGVLGCFLILLRKSVAHYVFIASLLGVVATMIHMFSVVGLVLPRVTSGIDCLNLVF